MAKSGGFSVDLGENGGRHKFKDGTEFIKWLEEEQARWDWLSGINGVGSLWPHVANHHNNLLNWARSLDPAQMTSEVVQNSLHPIYGGPTPQVFYSKSPRGLSLAAIRKEYGDTAAATAYAIAVGQLTPDWRYPEHTRATLLLAMPSLMGASITGQMLEEQIGSFEQSARELLTEQRHFADASQQDWQQLTSGAVIGSRKALRRFLRTGVRAKRSIKAVENAYRQEMQFKAAVTYWDAKRESHQTARGVAFSQLKRFLWIGGFAAFGVFTLAILVLLELAGVDALPCVELTAEGKTTPPALYLIVTAIAATFISSGFWAARILVRNYLTERMLERDAEERRTMTMTYLALVAEGRAEESDRLVVLNALFRAAPGSAGGDDTGGGEVALPAIVAKLLDQRR